MTESNLSQLRQRAERAMRDVDREGFGPGQGEAVDVSLLLEELRVYQAELEIQNSELVDSQKQITLTLEKYHNLFRHLPLPALLLDDRGFVVEANRQASELLGLRGNPQLQHRAVMQLFQIDSRERLHLSLRTIQRGRGTHRVDRLRLNVQGDSHRFCDVHLLNLPDSPQQPPTIILILVDRTLDLALQESNMRFQTLANSAPVLIGITDPQQHASWFNQRWLDYRGRDLDEELGQGWLTALHEEDRLRLQERVEQAANDGVGYGLELRLRDRDGRFRWHWHQAVPHPSLLDQRQGFIGTSVDIHDQKIREDRLRMAACVFETALEAIFITDPVGRILEVNESFTRLTGYSEQDALGETPRILNSGRYDQGFYQRFWTELLAKGRWRGELWNRKKSGDVYLQRVQINSVRDQEGRIRYFVAFATDITSEREHEEHLKYIAHYDSLTRLPNRVLFNDRLQVAMAQASRSQQRLAVAFVDLDGFKQINESLGHPAGDAMLRDCACNMKEVLREGDTLARLGGDEFVVLISQVDSRKDTLALFKRLLAAASRPVSFKRQRLQVSASIGITFYPQADQDIGSDQLIRQADQAMYQAKLNGKNRYHLFDLEDDHQQRYQREGVEAIRRGLAAEEFVLYYQPKVNLRSGAVIGFEALVRWQHPTRGLIGPAEFLPLIESHPLMNDLGDMVLQRALWQLQAWCDQGQRLEVSVNIAAQQLQEDFVQGLTRHLQAWPRVPRELLSLEILETSALEDLRHTSSIVRQLKELGIRCSLDDFGTGYSSLAYLKRLPVDEIKIDRMFVQDMVEHGDDFAIIVGVLGLSSAFRLKVIAEGMETPEHGVLLLLLGCELAQGFGIARPMPAAQVLDWLASWRPDPAWSTTPTLDQDKAGLLFACVEHKTWADDLTRYLNGQRSAPPEPSLRNCRFGEWLHRQPEAQSEADHPYREIRDLHKRLHALARQVVSMNGEGTPYGPLLAQFQDGSRQLLSQMWGMMGIFDDAVANRSEQP